MANDKYLRGASISDPTKKIFDIPDATPTITNVTDVGTGLAYGNNGQAKVYVSATPTTGGPITTFKVTSNPGSLTATSASPVTITGLTAGTAYTYTAQPANVNAVGPNASTASSAVTATTVPQAPTIGTAADGGTGTTATVAFTAGATGGSSITGYSVTSSPTTTTQSASSSPYTFTGLTAGTAYTFQVAAINANGTSAYSSASNSVTPVVPSNFFKIATVTGNNSATSLTFSSIPTTYKSLQIRGIAREVTGSGYSSGIAQLQFNGDTGLNYADHTLTGAGGTVAATANAGYNHIHLPRFIQGDAIAYTTAVGAIIIDIIDYASTSKYKTVRTIGGQDANNDSNGYSEIDLNSGLWRSTSAITSITITDDRALAFSSLTTFTLYGVS